MPATYLCQQNVDDFFILIHFLFGDILLGKASDLLGNLGLTLLPGEEDTCSKDAPPCHSD